MDTSDLISRCLYSQNITNPDGILVSTPNTDSNVRSVAVAVATQTPVLLQGPVGCGKTALVEHLAEVTGRHGVPGLLKVQLGDQTDSKLLLGTYCCTATPGEFVWQPGSLTQAVQHGYWILLEDIDYAPMDVLSVLVPLLETRSLLLPGHGGTIKAAQGFHMFATQRLMTSSTGFAKQQSVQQTSVLDKLWTVINVEPLPAAELEQVIVTKWPCLRQIVGRCLEVYYLLSYGKNIASHSVEGVAPEDDEFVQRFVTRDLRLTSTRDLLKWCQRIAQHFNLSSKSCALMVFQDAMDCFCHCIPKPNHRIPVAAAIGARFNVAKSKAEFYCDKYKPDIQTTNEQVVIGRASLPQKNGELGRIRRCRSMFSFTRSAVALLERVAVGVQNKEPILLVGETGTGKTATVQFLAEQTGQRLIVMNMNQQSDSTDLIGGYKPMDLKHIISPLREKYETIFCRTFSRSQNGTFLGHVASCFSKQKWNDLFKLMLHTRQNAIKKLNSDGSKRELLESWKSIGEKILQAKSQVKHAENSLAFAFVEGSLVKAVREGCWLLLDEINLAAPETLECLSGILESQSGSIPLLDKGELEPVQRHPDFHLFACMNPATDVGKKDLPAGVRNRFTEFFVDELEDENDLKVLVSDYLQGLSLSAKQVDSVVRFYKLVRSEAAHRLTDGTGHKPHFSLRTLCRALAYAARNPFRSVPRSLYEAFCLSFLTQLDNASYRVVEDLIGAHLVGKKNLSSVLAQPIPPPTTGNYVQVESYWIPVGDVEPYSPDKYILTASVRQNMKNLSRIIAAGTHPVLLQGETSVGKTSLIQYIAHLTGNSCMRINNHEHTDLQEYVGSYGASASGKLVFKEGVLVDAMRKGHWIILDELNLAPSEVLEALNRVLDDNRELFIAETQEVVRAHPQFMLFATQNPPGHYGGRKMLSRAFRNRFVELHFNEIPPRELETILHQRCSVPLSYCRKLVAVMTELQMRRRGSSVFAGKQGFITLRDLFRWGERYRLATPPSTKFYDWDQHLADEGYLLLAGRSRRPEECLVIEEVLGKYIKRKVDPRKLFTLDKGTSFVSRAILEAVTGSPVEKHGHIVWTFSLRRMAVLVGKALQFNEPVLLVGETGCGKTTICQIYSILQNKELYSVNCHMHSESADFLGGLRPVRHHSMDKEDEQQRLFEWVDGPLLVAMNEGSLFLADEISLADDSVLERLNSILESERSLVLAEKESTSGEVDLVVAKEGFQFLATMNPGGDYGKKELSPALRNRFTEIWCATSRDRHDLIHIIEHNMTPQLNLCNQEDGTSGFGNAMLSFLEHLQNDPVGQKYTISIRDILAWVNFIKAFVNATTGTEMDVDDDDGHVHVCAAYIHGAHLVFLDSLGSSVTGSCDSVQLDCTKQSCLQFLINQIKQFAGQEVGAERLGIVGQNKAVEDLAVVSDDQRFGMHPFYITKGESQGQPLLGLFTLAAPTTCLNAQRLLRALQLPKPVLLEGSPGVGKTSLVMALARASGHQLVRINLSEQTDVSDLFGADLPVEGKTGGHFAWRDGPLLQALKSGHWIVLDEMNLASQSVLEGLNACLDHRGEIFVPELGRTFTVKQGTTRIFACQNPLQQGGARKGLPRSFVNRFTQVYLEQLSTADLEYITRSMFPVLPKDVVAKMVAFNQVLHHEIVESHQWGQKGLPWEFNLRDVFRWAEVMASNQCSENLDPGEYIGLIYAARMRTSEDKLKVAQVYQRVFGKDPPPCNPQVLITRGEVLVGNALVPRSPSFPDGSDPKPRLTELLLLHHQLPALELLTKCVQMNWMAILVGPKSSGKSALVQLLALLTGHQLQVFTMNSATDTMDLLGGFEQFDAFRQVEELETATCVCLKKLLGFYSLVQRDDNVFKLLLEKKQRLETASHMTTDRGRSSSEADAASSINRRLGLVEDALRYCTQLHATTTTMTATEEDVEPLLQRVCQMRERLTSDGETASSVVHGGGQFEWVDSVLVQALRSGHWLLLDNVNFCSPSVLDRLNGLLEPKGVLTMNERGAVDGNILTITPHPNFRLFLALDPKHGEISRAMRNRGLEIYTLGEDEGNPPDQVDIFRLLSSIGLKSHTLQTKLLDIHAEMRDSTAVWEKPGLLNLYRCAFLWVKQMEYGFGVSAALRHSCFDTYIRGQKVTTKKQELTAKLETHLADVVKGVTGTGSDSWSVQLLPSATDYAHRPAFAAVQLQAAILLSWCHQLSDSNDGVMGGDLLIPSLLDPCTHLLPILLWFTHMASPADMDLRLGILDVVLSRLRAKTDLHECVKAYKAKLRESIQFSPSVARVEEKLRDVVSGLADKMFSFAEELPLDMRRYPHLMNLLATHCSKLGRNFACVCAELCSANNVHYLLVKLALQNIFELKLKRGRKSSPWHLSQLAAEGKLSSESLPHAVLEHIVPFFAALDAAIEKLFNSSVISCSDQQMWILDDALRWRKYFLQLVTTFELTPNELAFTAFLGKMALHWMWLKEHTVSVLRGAFDNPADKSLLHLDAVFQHMDKFLNVGIHPRHLLAESLRKTLGTLPPLQSDKHARLERELRHLSSVCDVWSKDVESSNTTKTLRVLHVANDEEGTRYKLADGYVSSLLGNQSFDEVFSVCGEVETVFRDKKLTVAIRDPQEEDPVLSGVSTESSVNKKLCVSVQLWPLFEHVNLHLEVLSLTSIASRNKSLSESLVNKFIQQGFEMTSTPPVHMALYMAVREMLKEGKVDIQYIPQMIINYNHRLQNCTATESLKHWLTWGLQCGDNVEGVLAVKPQVTGVSALQCAQQTCINMRLMVPEVCSSRTEEMSPVQMSCAIPLGWHCEKLEQSEMAVYTFWRNAAALPSRDYCMRLNQFQLLTAIFHNVLAALVECQMSSYTVGDSFCDAPAQLTQLKSLLELACDTPVAKDDADLKTLMCKSYEALSRCSETISKDPSFALGKAWLCIGLLQMELFSAFGPVDPVQRQAILLDYTLEEQSDAERELEVNDWHQRIELGPSLQDASSVFLHPHIRATSERRDVLAKTAQDLRQNLAVRPLLPQFDAVAHDIRHFMGSIGSKTTVLNVVRDMKVALKEKEDASSVLARYESWAQSVRVFTATVAKRYPYYRDLCTPFLSAVAQLSIGMNLLSHSVKTRKALSDMGLKVGDVDHVLQSLAAFPCTREVVPNNLYFVEGLLSPRTLGVIKSVLGCETEVFHRSTDSILTSCLLEVKNFIVVIGTLGCGGIVLGALVTILKELVLRWQQQEDEKRRKQVEKDRTFEFRTKTFCDEPTEEVQDSRAIEALFPTYNKDFEDFEPMELDDGDKQRVATNVDTDDSSVFGDLSPTAMAEVCRLHYQLFTGYTNKSWLRPMPQPDLQLDFITPFLERYQVASAVMKTAFHLTDSDLDSQLTSGNILYNTIVQKLVSADGDKLFVPRPRSYDFYQDPNVVEVVQCRSILEALSARIQELLLEWPEHPTLMQVQAVIDRVKSFIITEPLMKFVTGLELVLTKAQEWEMNAHKGVSLLAHLESLTQLIIQWRKLELKCWSSCLDNVVDKLDKSAAKWWFHVFVLIQSYLQGEENETGDHPSRDDLVKTIQQFMERTTLAEYGIRLRMLLGFHCHLANLPHSTKQGDVLRVLWNAHQYYGLFEGSVVEKIAQLRKPIEKEVKNFVKISRWNDSSFWAIKQTVEKSHRTLYKHMKQFEKVLQQPAQSIFLDSNPAEPPQPLQSSSTDSSSGFSAALYTSCQNSKDLSTVLGFTGSSDAFLLKCPQFFRKVKKLCRNHVNKTCYNPTIQFLDEFAGEIAGTMQELQCLEMDKNATKEKQRSEAKSIHTRKRKALADLFKHLQTTGISYRKGMHYWNEKTWAQFMFLPPIEVDAAVNQMQKTACDTDLLGAWEGCTKYFYRSVSRLALLRSLAEAPHKDLGLGNLNRICGFPSHLMEVTQKHYCNNVVDLHGALFDLRFILSEIDSCINHPDEVLPPRQLGVQHHKDVAVQLLVRSRLVLEQFLILLHCCPQELPHSPKSLVLPHANAAGFLMNRGSSEWCEAVAEVQDAVKMSQETYSLLSGPELDSSRNVHLYSEKSISTLKRVFSHIARIAKKCGQFSSLFEMNDSGADDHCFIRGLCDWKKEALLAKEDFDAWKVAGSEGDQQETGTPARGTESSTDRYEAMIKSSVKTVLIAVQEVMKGHASKMEVTSTAEFPEGKSGDADIEVNAFLMPFDGLSGDVAKLRLKRVIKLVSKAVLKLQNICSKPDNPFEVKQRCVKLLKCAFPFLEQYCLLVQFYLQEAVALHRAYSKMLAVLLGVFNVLLQKGFCIPEEYSDELSGEGSTEFHDIEGGGIGEGEGLKDVSDKIETEDQLEGAQPEGSEKKEEEQKSDIKEEEHGIEMSEDFEGRAHDPEERGDEDDSDDSNEDDDDEPDELDKQMGDVDDGEKLDEKIWGTDDESESENEEDKEDEFGPGDQRRGESKLVAKDDNKGVDQEDDGSDQDEDDRVDNREINPIDETEYDDDREPTSTDKQKQPEAEPEPMEIADDFNLDGEEDGDGDENEEQEKLDDANAQSEDNKEPPEEVDENEEVEKEDGERNKEQEPNDEKKEGEEDSLEKSKTDDATDAPPIDEPEEEKDISEDIQQHAADKRKAYAPTQAASEQCAEDEAAQDQAQQNAQMDSKMDVSDRNREGEKESAGMAESDQLQGQIGTTGQSQPIDRTPDSSTQQDKRQRPGVSNQKRTLGNEGIQQRPKRLRTVEQLEKQTQDGAEPNMETDGEKGAELFQHVAEQRSGDVDTVDAATVEQAKEQAVVGTESEMEPAGDDNVEMADESAADHEEEVNSVDQKLPSKLSSTQLTAKDAKGETSKPEEMQDEDVSNNKGDNITTAMVGRGQESSFHTNLTQSGLSGADTAQEVEQVRLRLEQHLAEWNQWRSNLGDSTAAVATWQQFETLTLPLAQELCEQLRLVLEPSLASKLRGDYRTGKRLNMRKVIPYIASQFRKDKIWLRRTKPSKRQYQIMVAVDDSASMSDNQVKELAFESLAVISKALTLLEAGELSVASFGETFRLLHPFHEQFTDASGAQILQQFTFEQKKTRVGQLLDEAVNVMVASESSHSQAASATAQLLIVISDGRGIFVEGSDVVQAAIRRARENHIFVVFVALDLWTNKDSIFDIRVPVFKDAGQLPEIKSYMDDFPFPFYVVLREISSLPSVLSDALRQWFELVTAIE